MKIYTKQGDAGFSTLFNGEKVPKNHPRLETFGTVDELNSHLGLVMVSCPHTQMNELLRKIQHQLFCLGSDLATPRGAPKERKVQRISEKEVRFLEEQIDAVTDQLPPLKRFILPGGGLTAARLHVARTVCRRAERLLAALQLGGHPSSASTRGKTSETVGEHALIYLNRLGDLLFVLARLANKLEGIADIEWDAKIGRNKRR